MDARCFVSMTAITSSHKPAENFFFAFAAPFRG
jgi:hypothetical protein